MCHHIMNINFQEKKKKKKQKKKLLRNYFSFFLCCYFKYIKKGKIECKCSFFSSL